MKTVFGHSYVDRYGIVRYLYTDNLMNEKKKRKTNSISPLRNPPRKIPKRHPILPIHNLPQIRLCKHRQRIPCNPHPMLSLIPRTITTTSSPLDKMRHGAELSPRDQLQGLSCLESKTVFGDVDFDGFVCSRADVEACLGVR